MKNKPTLINGGFFEDTRGRIDFVNDFDLSEIKRMYCTTNKEVNVFRGWQGHRIESRWFFCAIGKFEVQLIKIENIDDVSRTIVIEKYILEAKTPQVLFIPSGYLNGFTSLEEDSKLIIMSNFKLGENPNDEVRFDNNKLK
tara:strand:- start:228 stop:650 length:423 start_codon:yes stop_codon:yes gene_type:complete